MKNVLTLLLVLTATLTMVSCKKDKGEAASTNEAQEVSKTKGSASYNVNSAASNVLWEGYKPTGTHNGTLKVSEGTVEVKDGKVAGGSFVMDMASINVLDLEGDKKANLEGHLKGSGEEGQDDFFNVTKYPTAKYEITKVVNLDGDEEANQMIYGNLTVKDQTHNVGFKAMVDVNDKTVTVKTPKFNIDRTKWNVQYGSKSIFKNLGDNFVNDEIGLEINLNANR